MTFKKNLLLGLCLSLALLIISSLASYVSINNLIENAQTVRNSNRTIKTLERMLSAMKDAETGQRGYLLTGDNAFLEPYIDARKNVSLELKNLSEQVSHTHSQKKRLEILKSNINNRIEILETNLRTRRDHKTLTTSQLLKGKKYMDEIREVTAEMQNEEQQILKLRTENMEKLASYTPYLIVVSALLAITITLFFFRRVFMDYNDRVKLNDELEIKNQETIDRLHAIEKVAALIAEGEYDILANEEIKQKLGNVAQPLKKMAQGLETSFNTLEEKEWLSASVAELNERMMGEKTIDVLAEDIVQSLIEHTESQVAAIYILGADHALHLTTTYALERKQMPQRLASGEGIVGEAFRSLKTILIDKIPDNELTISYASGNTQPQNIVAIPICRENQPLGVLEIGAAKTYSTLELEFLKTVAGNIGIAFFSAQSRVKLQELLEETQAQAEELQTQHTELENINAELEAQSQKLLASEEELRVQQEELLETNQELEERTSLLEEKNELIEQRNLDIQQKSIELEQSTKYKSEFLANMSHELRTPLNSILLLSKLMTESEDLEEQYVEYAEVMQSSGQGLLTLIDEILDLSKIESGKMTLEILEVPIAEIVQDMHQLFSPMTQQKNLNFNIEKQTFGQTIITTDKLRLEQILKNLFSNAIKFTSQGKITFKIHVDESAGCISFSVADTGIGIAKEKLHMIFEAFQQADGSTQRKYGGTGLGLSISRQLAKLLHGEISLKSEENIGSEFTLTLPIVYDEICDFDQEKKQESPEKIETQETVAFDKTPQTIRFLSSEIPAQIADDRENIEEGDKIILIIEDDTAFAKILLDFARQRNYKAIVAVRGDVGIELAEYYKPIAILLDIQLPVMDGWQVMDALKANPETKPIPVHIMSSMKVKQESLLRGAVDFIDKPIALEQMQIIFKKLEDVLHRSPKKVLIVEENQQHAKALSYFLSTNQINTDIANNIEQSIDALKKREVDCVILDMGVPDRGAYQTLETIKQIEGLENLPIIIFTGKNLSKGEESRIRKYADSIVVKTAYSYQRILDEAGLFLHLVEQKNKKNENLGLSQKGEMRNILKDKTVLIADDDVRNIFSLTKALELQGMKVISAMDGKEALNVLNATPKIDVVLMDMMMPEMDGYESIRQIRNITAFKNLPVLAVTSKAMMGDREKCIAAGASDYISKPVDIDQLVSLLRVWLYDKI